MGTKHDKYTFNLVELILSMVGLFLLLIITYPILQKLIKQTQKSQIEKNLNQIRYYSDQYFEEHGTNSVSIYEFIGPRKIISELKIIADEKYPEIILRGKEISAYSEKYGEIVVP